MIRQIADMSFKGVCKLLVGAVLASSGSARAQNFEQMQGWSPSTFEIICGDSGRLSGLANQLGITSQDCIDDVARRRIENFAEVLLGEYRNERFQPPYQFGPVIDGANGAGRAVRIFTSSNTTYANIAPVSGACDPADQRVFTINPENASKLPKNVLAYIIGHELFHTIQGNFPIDMWPGRSGPHNCFPPYWVTEGIADAVSISRARQLVPGYFPPRPDQKAGFSWAGLRPYYVPLYSPGIIKTMQYRTSSFWRFLAETYHGGRLKFLEDYSMTTPPGGKNNEDWLAWLDDALLSDPKIETPLHLIYPGFLSHFAGDWVKRGDGEKFGRSMWLSHAFGACVQLNISPDKPYEEKPMSLYPMAGKCLSVNIQGLAPADRATVKIGALTDNQSLADSLHLGFAFTNDRTRFNCARLARKYSVPKGGAGCLFEPVTGTLGSGTTARMWHASSLELGPGTEQTVRNAGDAIENVYVLSRVPPEPRLMELRRKGAADFRIAAGLEWSTLSVDGTSVNSGGADGTRSAPRRRAVAAMGIHPLETDMMVPPSTGWVDHQGLDAITGGEIWDMEILDMIAEVVTMGSEKVNRLTMFSLAEARIVPQGVPPTERIEVLREIAVFLREPLPDGATGSFPAFIGGGDRANNLQYYTENLGDATLTIEENSRGAFRASVSGVVCVVDLAAFTAMAASGGKPNPCPRKVQVSGAISKPFAYLYRGDTRLVSEETEGEKLYNRYGPPRLMREMFGGGDGDGDGDGAGGGGGGGGAGGVGSSFCQCTCPDLAVPPTALCRTECEPKWAMCEIAAETPPEPAPAPKPPMPTVEAQRKWFSRLVGGQGLAPEVEEMLIEDFVTMSAETRKYLIRQYRGGVK